MTADTPADGLAALRAASDAATPGPWEHQRGFANAYTHSHGDSGLTIHIAKANSEQVPSGFGEAEANAAFIALSENHARALLAGDAATWADLLASAPVEALAGALEAVMDDVPRDIANRADSAARGATPMDPWEEETNYHAVVSAYLRALATGDAP